MNAYLFFHSKLAVTLAEVLAKSEAEAWEKLPIQHSWADASPTNCRLTRVVSIEAPLMFDALLPSYS